jgi:hypothetical protein
VKRIEFDTLLDAVCKVGNNLDALRYLLKHFEQYVEDHSREVITDSISKEAFILATNRLGDRKMVTVSEVCPIHPSYENVVLA